jgi:single-stranded DNA-binding protein
MREGFQFQGTGKLARIDRFTSKAGKQILTLIFHQDGQWPQWIPIKVFGRLADMASEWNVGDVLEVSGELGGRDWNGKVYGDATARTVEVVSRGAQQNDGLPDESPNERTDLPREDDDVPF